MTRSLGNSLGRWPWAIAGFGLAVACAACGAACGGSRNDAIAPTVPLSSSIEAQTELRGIEASFAQSSRAERQALEDRLLAFQERYPKDALGPVADVMLAWIALERGDLSRATELSSRAETQTKSVGTTAELARMIQGAALRRSGKAEAALGKLLPLLGKLIDPHARTFLNEEATASAIGAKHHGQAIELMLVWLHEASIEERAEVRSKLAELLASIPPAALAPILEARRKQHPEPLHEELEVQKTLIERLSGAAISARDQQLARRLLAAAMPLLGTSADELAELAAGAGGARVEAPTLGLVLPTRSLEARRRGTQVVSGVMFGLGLPGSAARLVTRDDLGRDTGIEDALEGLGADGAAIVIAGVDREEATIAAKFAERESIPVVLLHPPAPDVADSAFVFVVGEEPERVRKALVGALPAKGQVVWVGDKGSVDMAREEAFECTRLPPSWRGIGGVVVYGSCVSDVLLSVSGSSVKTAVGLDLGGVNLPKGTFAATAGAYPIDPRAPGRESLSAWMAAHPDPPSLWAGLGRDAAVLAWVGVEGLPTQGTRDPKEVKRRREQAAAALAVAERDLWTTEAKGFGGARRLARTIGVREVR
ncbi:hypothetical protein [Polyangium mundeleinium]|uniref:Leucine-binding protein domain-containing protein n=1 Tax=Polyangium mundeleinium TaxID=2995306 RepID=A0ABT5F878_9BACT|nr:hypothetical protein [Polyangium mundeleinium]MDC0749613.1 hypothetical protein [Polyangium mundeleinium]